MATVLIRATPDSDAYAAWSTVVDAFVFVGTLADARDELGIDDDPYFVRAHDTGCSTIHRLRDWSFKDRAHSSGWRTHANGSPVRLPADRLGAYIADVLATGDWDAAMARNALPVDEVGEDAVSP